MNGAATRIGWWIGCLGGLMLFAVWGVARVPFHPDESSWLYMSRDVDVLVSRPWALGWRAEAEADPYQAYRELNAPLAVYALGLARWLVRAPAPTVDWDWSQTWEANVHRGALPESATLWSARLVITLCLPVSLALMYQTARQLGGEGAGWGAALLLGLNGLVLLHGRRAMAEGVLMLGMAFASWTLLSGTRRPWLVGLAVGLAVCAKQSALALLPVGALAVAWPSRAGLWRTSVGGLVPYALGFGLTFFLLNPLLWSQPLGALQAMWQDRQSLIAAQTAAFESVSPGSTLPSLAERGLVLLAHAFFTPPAFADVANYAQATAPAEAAYLRIPGHLLLRGWLGGGVMLGLTVWGLGLAAWRLWRRVGREGRALVLLSCATLSQVALLLIAIPLPFQRYSLPLIPLACLWAGYGVGLLIRRPVKR